MFIQAIVQNKASWILPLNISSNTDISFKLIRTSLYKIKAFRVVYPGTIQLLILHKPDTSQPFPSIDRPSISLIPAVSVINPEVGGRLILPLTC